MSGKVSVLIPAFNEEKTIIDAIKETIKVFERLDFDYEIIVIDDGSVDNTSTQVKNNANIFNNKVQLVKHQNNSGKGFAIKQGFNAASGDYVLFLDADLDLHPQQVVDFLHLIESNEADLVIGSKMHKESVVDYPLTRKILSFGYYVLVRILFNLPVKDTQTGLKLFKYELLEKSLEKIIVKKYAFDLELLVVLNKLKFKIMEAPIYLKPTRKFGRIGFMDIYYVMLDTIAIFYRLYIKKYYD
jgi:glycosyltransferase involved in cell wall biosynthesis